MRKILLTFEYFMPLSIIGTSLFFLASLGFFLVEYGGEHHKLKGLLIIIFSSAGVLSIAVIGYRFRQRRKAFQALREIHFSLQSDDIRETKKRLKKLILNGRLSDMQQMLYFMLARSHQLLDEFDDAKRAYEASQGFWGAQNNLAVLLIAEEKYEDAIEHLKKAISLNLHEAFLYNQLAWTLQKIDEPVLARKVLETAREYVLKRKTIDENIKRLGNDEEVVVNSQPLSFRLKFLR